MNIQDLSERMRIVDPSNLKEDFDAWPELARRTWTNTPKTTIGRDVKTIVLAGMGGSGIVGDIVTDVARRMASKIQFEVINNYHIPESVPEDALVIGISASGNTAETLSFVAEAERRGIKGVVISSGGKMEEFAKLSRNFTFIKTEILKVPRSTFSGLIFAVLKLLSDNSLLDVNNDIEETIECLGRVRDECCDIASNGNKALEIAAKIVDDDRMFIPIIYGARYTRAAGRRFRQSLNENAKVHAFSGEIPEICHNSIVGWDTGAALANGIERIDGHHMRAIPILLKLDEDPPEVQARFGIVEKILKETGIEPITAPYIGRSYLSKTFSLIYYLEYVTYYTAILRGVNPILTPSIDRLKSELEAMGKGY